jgi:GNAT superfamily N-acetyltransferase
MTHTTGLEIQAATPADVPLLLQLIRELAQFESLLPEVVATEELLHQALFGPRPVVEAVVARSGGAEAGFALFFHNFSTFLGRSGIYLEDLFVRPAFRGQGIGKALLVHLARIAVARGCGRVEWAVLDWNRPARDFYEGLGAQAVTQWMLHRITGPAMQALADGGGCD